MNEMTEFDDAIIETCNLIIYELEASGAQTTKRIEHWLKEQCTFNATHIHYALGLLESRERIIYDVEDGEGVYSICY